MDIDDKIVIFWLFLDDKPVTSYVIVFGELKFSLGKFRKS